MAALSNRGWVFVDQEKWDKARTDFEIVLNANPQDQAALQGIARVLERSRDYAGAQKALGQLIAGSSNFVFWLEWGRVGLIRYYWILLLFAIALFFRARMRKARTESHGG
jgi:tetratricopeptide (TPR) repeat protein